MQTKHTITRTCEQCDMPFEAVPWQRFKGQTRRFCSRGCANVSRRIDVADRFWRRVDRSRECWLWTGGTSNGYGTFGIAGKETTWAHRYAWRLAAGADAGELAVLHCCDTPLCCRNDDIGTYEVNGVHFSRRGHLWLGTRADNVADMVAKGRQQRGERSGHARLSAQEISEIRRLREAGERLTTLAGMFEVSMQSIMAATDGIWRFGKRYRSWSHIPDL